MPEIQFKKSERSLNPNAVAAVVAGGATTVVAVSPASANAGVTSVNDTMTAVATVASGAIAILVLALGARLAVKQVNRVLTKG